MPEFITISETISLNNSSTFKLTVILKIKHKNPCFYNSVLAVSLQKATPDSNTWERKLAAPIMSQLKLSILYRF